MSRWLSLGDRCDVWHRECTCIKVDGYTFRGSNSLIFIFASHLRGQLLKSRPYFERAALSRKANRKSQKLFPFVKMIENHGGVLLHLKFDCFFFFFFLVCYFGASFYVNSAQI